MAYKYHKLLKLHYLHLNKFTRNEKTVDDEIYGKEIILKHLIN